MGEQDVPPSLLLAQARSKAFFPPLSSRSNGELEGETHTSDCEGSPGKLSMRSGGGVEDGAAGDAAHRGQQLFDTAHSVGCGRLLPVLVVGGHPAHWREVSTDSRNFSPFSLSSRLCGSRDWAVATFFPRMTSRVENFPATLSSQFNGELAGKAQAPERGVGFRKVFQAAGRWCVIGK